MKHMNTKANEHGEWTDRLSDFLDGTLAADDHAEVGAHLIGCGSCRQVLEELREVSSRARSLGPVDPPRDLWGDIAATIQASARVEASDDAKVIELPMWRLAPDVARFDEPGVPRRFVLSSRQLVAASVILIAASSLVTWVVGPGLGVQVDTSAQSLPIPVEVSPLVRVASPPPDLVDELAALERVVREGTLDPNTLRVLHRNLGVIEKAIADSRRALAQDPGNDFLAEHIDRAYQRKLEYLREAARVAEWAG